MSFVGNAENVMPICIKLCIVLFLMYYLPTIYPSNDEDKEGLVVLPSLLYVQFDFSMLQTWALLHITAIWGQSCIWQTPYLTSWPAEQEHKWLNEKSTVTWLKVMPWQRDVNHPSLLISYRQRKVEVTSTLDTFIFCFHYTVDDCSPILLAWFIFPIKHEKTTHAWPQVSNSVLNASQSYWNAEKQTSYITIFVGAEMRLIWWSQKMISVP